MAHVIERNDVLILNIHGNVKMMLKDYQRALEDLV
jgi:hypothetical protein